MSSSSVDNSNFCLRWNDFSSNVTDAFAGLYQRNRFADISLVVDDPEVKVVRAHRVVLAASSPFFDTVLSRPLGPGSNPVLYLRGVKASDLRHVIKFIYQGEVNVAQEELDSFLAVAQDLKIRGLCQNSTESKPSFRPESRLKREAPSTQDEGQPAKRRPQVVKRPPFVATEDVKPVPICDSEQLTDNYSQDGQGEAVEYEEYYPEGDEVVDVPDDEVGEELPGTSTGSSSTQDITEMIEQNTTKLENGSLCLLCGKVLQSGTGLKVHFRDKHSGSTDRFCCPVCKSIYKNRNSFSKHVWMYHKELKGLDYDTCLVKAENV